MDRAGHYRQQGLNTMFPLGFNVVLDILTRIRVDNSRCTVIEAFITLANILSLSNKITFCPELQQGKKCVDFRNELN